MSVKYMKYLAILGAIVGLLVIGAPVSAAPLPVAPPATYIVRGVEIFPGIDIAGNNYGATFIAQATATSAANNVLYNGSLSTSINYQGTDPVPGKTNTIIGGSWTLSVYQDGTRSTIVGKIIGGIVSWFPKAPPTDGTDYGQVGISLKVISANGVFQSMMGHTGTFSGADNHTSGIFIAGIQVPTVYGILTIN